MTDLLARIRASCLRFVLVLVVAGCSEAAGIGPSAPTPDASDDAPTTDAGTGEDGGLINHDGGACEPSCSPDLRRVVDCKGDTLEQCGADRGCSPEAICVAACAAADAQHSSIGCEFFTHAPDLWFNSWGSCYGVSLTNVWASPAELKAAYGTTSLDVKQIAYVPKISSQGVEYEPLLGPLPPGQTAVLFLAQYKSGASARTPCPPGVNVAVSDEDVAPHETRIATAFRLQSSVPAVAYSFAPIGAENSTAGVASAIASASLLLPSASWGDNYLMITPAELFSTSKYGDIYPWLSFIAREDDTVVTVGAKVDVASGQGVAGIKAGAVGSYTLQRGEVLYLSKAMGLLGSAVQSSKPIAHFAGHGLLDGDAVHQQVLPIPVLGSRYPLVPPRSRQAAKPDSTRYRFVGVVDGTKIDFEPSRPALALKAGEMVELDTTEALVASSQDLDHPFYVFEYMLKDASGHNIGDGEFSSVIPVEHAQSRYSFFMEPSYQNSHLVVVRARGASGFDPVALDCLSSPLAFSPLGLGGQYEFARVDLVTANAPQGSCSAGLRTLSGDGGFVGRAWGWSQLGFENGVGVSYAFPVGLGTKPINSVVVPPVPR